MNARRFAHKLAINGISSTRSSEGTEEVDGSIDITPKISIQIPTYGNRVGVVRESEDGETYLFYPSRPSSDLAGIVADVKKAIADCADDPHMTKKENPPCSASSDSTSAQP
jgi:hypothetical protein